MRKELNDFVKEARSQAPEGKKAGRGNHLSNSFLLRRTEPGCHERRRLKVKKPESSPLEHIKGFWGRSLLGPTRVFLEQHPQSRENLKEMHTKTGSVRG